MKKWIGFFLWAALIITSLLRLVKNGSIQSNPEGQPVMTTVQTKEVDLNTFLELYNQGTFEKVALKDVVKLEWYVPYTGEAQQQAFSLSFFQWEREQFTVYKTNKPSDTSLPELGIEPNGATIIDVQFTETSVLTSLLVEQILPLVFFILLLVLAFRFFGPKWWAGGLPFGTRTGKLRTNTDVKTKFADVAGMEEVKAEVSEIVDFLKHPKKYQKVGAKIPRGVLLWWPPGAGKTMLARAVAGEAGVPFFSASWSEFMEMLVGMGAAKVRELFKKAKAAAPAIIFIDEIDTIGRKRGAGYSGGHQEQEQTLNQILTEMDGFDTDTNVIVIAATNRPDILDSALLRSGRFDRKVMVGQPTLEERKMILEIHVKDKKLAPDADLNALARRTSGFVGADLANIINEAALRIAKQNRTKITMDDLDYALEKVVMGPEKKIKSLRAKEKEIVTYHELGHAVTAYVCPNADPVEKISIVSRGMALGVTWMMPAEDRYLNSKAKFEDELITLLGWRAAEEVFFGKDEITTGASNDFEKVAKIARSMLTKYGMDEELGTLVWYDPDKADFYHFKPFSEKLSQQIDAKTQALVAKAYKKSVAIIKKHQNLITKMAGLLMNKEYITKDEFIAMMEDPKKIDKLVDEFNKNHEKMIKKQERAEKKGTESKAKSQKAKSEDEPKELTAKETDKKIKKFLDS